METQGSNFSLSSAEDIAGLLPQDRGRGALELKGFNSMQINITNSLIRISENCFTRDIMRIPLPPATGEETESAPLITIPGNAT